ncbi:UPF0262 family protein [Pedomonas mirosovicensis]|uniref:UPF0262 family protein n=1 Tax=Pedomonas mirosovicensis TaxID=2908641 RepID=UPI0021678CE1|nr:UPF0262 family protein [Pedomonas mirosovicensis]MCH8683839.1 UPF0262 family protein [Pedomonas mirosovicensis]
MQVLMKSEQHTQRIIAVDLDERTILWRNADVEQERRVAIFDLLEGNRFAPRTEYPNGYRGPYKLLMRVEEGRLAFDISTDKGDLLETITLSMTPFRRVIREYFAICESYYQAIRNASPSQIEAIDMGRRGIHNHAAEVLQERIADKLDVDFDTARRLFTLICVLHIRG